MRTALSQQSGQRLSALRPVCVLGSYHFTTLEWGSEESKAESQPRHHHPFCEIVLLHAGCIVAETEEALQQAEAPAALVSLAGEHHCHQQDAPINTDWWALSIRKQDAAAQDGLDDLIEAWLHRRQAVANNLPQVSKLVADLEQEITKGEAGWRRACTWILQQLLLTVIRSTVSKIPQDSAKNLELEASLRAAVREQPQLAWSVADLAALSGHSERQLTRLLRKHADCSPLELVSSERIVLAQSLLLTEDEPIAEIAERVGYSDRRHFAKLFKRYSAVPPSDWRKRAQQYRIEDDG